MKRATFLIATILILQSASLFAETEFTLSVPETPAAASEIPVEATESVPVRPLTPAYNSPVQQKASGKGAPVKGVVKPQQKGGKGAPVGAASQKQNFPEGKGGQEPASLPATSYDTDSNSQIALPEITQRAILSRSDVNRIVCREPIKDIFFSDEKGLAQLSYSGNSAFIKFKVKQVGKDYEYVSMPADLTVICGESVYTLIGFPKAVPAQTIRLESGKKIKARENMSIFKDQPERVKAKVLIEKIYNDDIPSSFMVKVLDTKFVVFKDIATTLHKVVSVDGEGLVIKEFHLIPSVGNLELNEKDFLRREFVENPFAIAFTDLRPAKGERVRLFVVETRRVSPEGGADVH